MNKLGYGGAPGSGSLLRADPPAEQRESLAAIIHLEQAVLAATAMRPVVLRYGSFYGPGASDDLVGLVRKRRLPVIGDGAPRRRRRSR